ncbi:MAG: helix-turn-helix domain-containing protein [Clostridia bacterium]|nr:helix-turn-helix domain-containing protein [Clostridia bacterium]
MEDRMDTLMLGEIPFEVTLPTEGFHLYSTAHPGNPTQVIALHRHSAHELFFARGRLAVVTEQERYCYQNELVLIPPRLEHYIILEQGDCFCFYSASELLPEALTALPMNEEIRFYLEQLERHPRDWQAEHLLPLLFGAALQSILPQKTKAPTKHDRHIHTIDNYINGHYTENIRLTKLAELLYLCPRQVSRILQKEYGRSLSELVHQKRLAAAGRLLRHTDLPIAEIAAAVGYDQPNYFFARFKAQFNCTPQQYRKNA